ncbi:MAG: mandelate racemase/muconate lactonizing enzyme family protein [Burkholderiales bacterium]
MKLKSWKLHPIRLPYFRAIKWADVVEEAADFLLLEIESDTGARGIGEATVKPTWSGVTLRSLTVALEEIYLPKLATIALDDPEALLDAYQSIPEGRAARALIDNACWDLRANASGKPLHALLGAGARVEVCCTLTRAAPSTMAREAAELVGKYGFKTIKFKGGQGFDTDFAGLAAVRGAVGAAIRIYVDANSHYDQAQGIEYTRRLAERDVFLSEDPYRLAADRAFEQTQAELPIPILVDSPAAGLVEAATFLDRGARAISVKPGRVGLTTARRCANLAKTRNAGVVVGLYSESTLGTLAPLAFHSSLTNALAPSECTFFLGLKERITHDSIDVRDGFIILPPDAGYRALVDWDRVARFRVA